MNKKSICLVTPTFNLESAFSQIRDIIVIMSKNSFKIFVMTGKSFKTPEKNAEVFWISDEYENEKYIFLTFIKYLKSNLITIKKVFKLRKNFKTVMFYNTNYIPVILFSKLLRKKVIVLVLGDLKGCGSFWYQNKVFGIGDKLASLFFGALRRLSFFLADKVVLEYQNQISNFKYNSMKVRIAPIRLIDKNNFFIKIPFKNRRLIIGYVGRFSYEKGIINFIDSIPNVLNYFNDLEVHIIGGGPLEKIIKEKISEMNLEKNVKLIGWVNHEKLPDYLNDMKLLVMPSYTEALPGLLLESIACGVPVLSNSVGAIPEVITDEKTGFLISDNSPENISKGIIKALNAPNIEKIIKRSQKIIENKFNSEVIIETWRGIIEDN